MGRSSLVLAGPGLMPWAPAGRWNVLKPEPRTPLSSSSAYPTAVVERSIAAGLELLEDQDFIWNRVWPLVSDGAESPPHSSLGMTVHRSRADGRVVMEYRFGDSTRVFAKLYPDAAAGGDVHRIHDELCKHGFGPGSIHRVPEPIAYLDEHRVLLLRPAPGDELAAIRTIAPEAFPVGVTQAARWLVALHSSPVKTGPRLTRAQAAARLALRAARATACRPELEGVIRDSLAELERRRATGDDAGAQVQTHGRYHAAHVFVAPQCVTAIDLDRAGLADPARDVGEFLHGLRAVGAKSGIVDDAIDDACESFLGEYLRGRPVARSGLAYYWSYGVIWMLLGLAFKDRPARPGWKQRIVFLRAEFHDVERRAAALVER
jgi:aminoglycoside phosphotransferase